MNIDPNKIKEVVIKDKTGKVLVTIKPGMLSLLTVGKEKILTIQESIKS